MLISILFSLSIYEIISQELARIERIQRIRVEQRVDVKSRQFFSADTDDGHPPLLLDPEIIAETKIRLSIILIAINSIILISSGIAGYFLAGRTLKPISQMIEEQNRFITDASHELRTPLTSLKSEIEVSLRDKHLNLNQAKAILKSNLEEVNSLQKLSEGLMKILFYQKNINTSNFEDVSLFSIIEEAIKKINGLARSKKIKIINNVEKIIIQADKESLIELFVIFLDNAVKYSPSGSKVTLSSAKRDHFVEVRISDQGIGIRKDDIPHLFDRFYRADKSRAKTGAEGYGLGLSIAKQIVEEHRGSISVKSQPAKGSTFTVFLPIKHSSIII